MSTHRTAIVAGAGLGGITTAALLARQGYEVTVLEKNATPGGRCSQILRDGHRFDIGPTLFLMPEVFARTYELLGEEMADHLDLCRVDPTYTIRFNDGHTITLTSDLEALRSQVEAIEPGSFGGLLRYLEEGRRHYRFSLDHFVGRNFLGLLDYFNLRNLWLMVQLKALKKHYTNTGRYFQDPHLRAAFTFQDMYLGLSPYDAPATYSLLQYTELADGVWFPRGGMYQVVESLMAIARKNGVRFHFNTPVKRLAVDGDRIDGVILEDGQRLTADEIVANADLPYVYQNWLPDEGPAKRMDRLQYTCGTMTFYWGVDKRYPELSAHNVFLSGDYQASFERIFKDKSLPQKPSVYVHAPARIDPSAAPAGEETLMALVPIGHLAEDGDQDWGALKEQARSAVFRCLAEMGVTDLASHLKFEICLTPQHWGSMYNLAKGAAFGLSHNVLQVGYLRPHNQHSRYRNLYFTGGSTHPGSGLPMVMLSARLTSERILKNNPGIGVQGSGIGESAPTTSPRTLVPGS